MVETIFLRGVNIFCTSNLFKFNKNFNFRYKVWSVTPRTENQGQLLLLWEDNESIDFWEPLSRKGRSSRIMVAPDTQTQFVSFLEKNDIEHELIIENVERYFHKGK